MEAIKKTCAACWSESVLRPEENYDLRCPADGPAPFILKATSDIKEIWLECPHCKKLYRFVIGDRIVHKCGTLDCKTPYMLRYNQQRAMEKSSGRPSFPKINGGNVWTNDEDVLPISIIITARNGIKTTARCLDCALKTKVAEIILIDNNSDDGTQHWAQKIKNIIYVRNKINLGCAIGRNQGTAWASQPWILFLDNDQFIPDDLPKRLFDAETDLIGIEHWRVASEGSVKKADSESFHKNSYIGSGGMLVKKAIFESLSGYDERFAPAWYADTDFCFRAKASGYKIQVLESPGVIHIGGATVKTQLGLDSDIVKKESLKLFLEIWSGYLFKNQEPKNSKLKIKVKQGKSKRFSQNLNALQYVWEGMDEQAYHKLKHSETPVVTFAMLSWVRTDKLIRTLENLISVLKIKANLLLRVQGSEKLSDKNRERILMLTKENPNGPFVNSVVDFTEGNEATAGPRRQLHEKALGLWPDTPYFNFADDDTTYSIWAIEAALTALESDRSLGVCGVYFKPHGYRIKNGFENNKIIYKHEFNGVRGLTHVDVLGSATAFIRKEVFDLCAVNPDYFLGMWDWDFFLQARKVNWKLATLVIPELHAINAAGGPREYVAARRNKTYIARAVKMFIENWRLAEIC